MRAAISCRDGLGLLRDGRERELLHGRRPPAAPPGSQPLVQPVPCLEPMRVVVADEAVGRLEDRRMRPVAGPEHDAPHVWLVRELEQVLHGRAPEGVDGLVVVTHEGDLAMTGDQAQQLELRWIHVLRLVHEHVAVPAPHGRRDGRALPEQADRQRHLVPEVDEALVPQQRLVPLVGRGELRDARRLVEQRIDDAAVALREPLGRGPRASIEVTRIADEVVGGDALVLGAREQVGQRRQQPRRVAQRAVPVETELEQVLPEQDHLLGATR